MTFDPFSDAPADDNDINNDTPEFEKDDVNVNETTPHTEVSVTLKGGTGFDAPWVVVRASSVPAAEAMLDEDMQSLLKKAAKYGQAFAGLAPASPNSSGGKPAGGGNGGGRPARKEHPTGRQEFCVHGEMEYKTGVSKQGNAYKVFSCTSRDRNDQCDGIFDR